MSEVKEEYTRETYPSFGKKYNDEKAIISLTSWRARINTVSKTLFSLLKQCPGFHIVLVLSEEEFPKMMDELPENLKLFVDNELIELMFVYKNYKSFKKVLFTMDKYRDVPVISADDDCIYTCNYAQELYNKWKETGTNIVDYCIPDFRYAYTLTQGPCWLYENKNSLVNDELLKTVNNFINYKNQDDIYLSDVFNKFKFKVSYVSNIPYVFPYKFHTTVAAINPHQYKGKAGKIALGQI